MGLVGKSAILDKEKGTFTIDEAVVPDPGPGEVLVRQALCGVCGTDVHIYNGHMRRKAFPLVLGHEIVGTIEKMGPGVDSDCMDKPVQEGDHIAVIPGQQCGTCYFCTVVREPGLCPNVLAYGFRPYGDTKPHFQGGYAEYVLLNIPRTKFLKVQSTPEVAVLLEPFEPGSEIRLVLVEDRNGFPAGESRVSVKSQNRQALYDLELEAFIKSISREQSPDRSLSHELLVQETLLRATRGLS